jgi:hypothetical protein
MKVSKAIELLSELNPDEEICISWWESNLFTDDDDEPLKADSEEWVKAVDEFDIEGGYETLNEQVWNFLYFSITGKGEF